MSASFKAFHPDAEEVIAPGTILRTKKRDVLWQSAQSSIGQTRQW
jgi:hypothetical protein